MQPTHFNIRVYGIWIDHDRLLVNDELIHGRRVLKFPGGGLVPGEGLIDGLKREWREELDADIIVAGHFYTTDFFQTSAFGDNSQVISVYYLVSGDAGFSIVNAEANERTYWMPLSEVHEDLFTLPIDKVVAGMIRAKTSCNNLA